MSQVVPPATRVIRSCAVVSCPRVACSKGSGWCVRGEGDEFGEEVEVGGAVEDAEVEVAVLGEVHQVGEELGGNDVADLRWGEFGDRDGLGDGACGGEPGDRGGAGDRGDVGEVLVEGGSGDAGLFDESGDADLRYRLHVQQAGGGVQECGAAALHARVDWLGCAGGTHGSSVSQTC